MKIKYKGCDVGKIKKNQIVDGVISAENGKYEVKVGGYNFRYGTYEDLSNDWQTVKDNVGEIAKNEIKDNSKGKKTKKGI